MNNAVKNVIIFIAGIGFGAFTAKIILDKKYDKIITELEDELVNQYDEKNEQLAIYSESDVEATAAVYEQLQKEKTELVDDYIENDIEQVKKQMAKFKPEGNLKQLATNYNKIFNGQDPDTVRAMPKTFVKLTMDNDKPYVITVQEYSESDPTFEQTTITYYDQDDTLVDENEEPIADVTAVIGDQALDKFGEGSDDPDIVYVRNEVLSTDYEVIRIHKSYAEVIGME